MASPTLQTFFRGSRPLSCAPCEDHRIEFDFHRSCLAAPELDVDGPVLLAKGRAKKGAVLCDFLLVVGKAAH